MRSLYGVYGFELTSSRVFTSEKKEPGISRVTTTFYFMGLARFLLSDTPSSYSFLLLCCLLQRNLLGYLTKKKAFSILF
jgi:hypothetical protein